MMKSRLFWLALMVLIILHHDWWLWSDGSLLFGYVPVGLAYHAMISLAAGVLWAVAVFYAMPEVFEADREEGHK